MALPESYKAHGQNYRFKERIGKFIIYQSGVACEVFKAQNRKKSSTRALPNGKTITYPAGEYISRGDSAFGSTAWAARNLDHALDIVKRKS